MKITEIAKILANRINQEKYILHYINKIYQLGYKKGLEDSLYKTDINGSVCDCIKNLYTEGIFVKCSKCDKTINIQEQNIN